MAAIITMFSPVPQCGSNRRNLEGTMKRRYMTMAILVVTMMMAGYAAASDSVDIGMGRMDRAEFEVLQQMVRGDYRPTAPVTTNIPQTIHVAEFDLRDVESIRQAMITDRDEAMTAAAESEQPMVDIGLGSMSTNEFCDLNKLVASNTTARNEGFDFICP
ncbi:MAG TPA: hypothetical protein VLT88_11980 [Desulfosarcina sp.]|nr:hypothetical protein [Desulfosarcina sp.]